MKTKTMKLTGIFLTLVLLVTMLGVFSMAANAAETVVAWKDTDNDGIQDSGEATYTNLSTALSAGGIVKLTANYTLGNNATDEQYISMSSGTATLDLNGHTLTCASLIKKEIIVLSGTADLTITDSKTTGVLNCQSRADVQLSDSAKLTIAGGNIMTVVAYARYYLSINKSENAIFQITGGKHYSIPNAYVAVNHKVTVNDTDPRYTVSAIETNEVVAWNDADNDGVIDSGEQIFSDIDTAFAADVDLKMNSDIFRDSQHFPPGALETTSTRTIDLNGYSIVASAYCLEVKGGTLTIKDSAGGGQLWCQNDEKYAAIAVYSGSNIGLTVESGTILGSIANYGASSYPDAVVLNGGNYNFDPSEYMKDSTFTAGQDSSGLWGIRPKAETACSVTIHGTYKYTGEAITPTIVVTDLNNGKALTEGTDYTVSLSNNVNAGTATATVTFINDYRGSISKDFTIVCDHTLSEHTTAEENIGYGKHRFVCSVCNGSSTETHKFNESNECICGVKAVASVTTTSTPPVETKYATIDEAIVAARSMSGSTVKLLNNIQLDDDLNISMGKFIIDLNGKTLSEASGFSDINLIALEGIDTEITIDDSSAEKNGKITFGAGTYTISVCSKLIVKNGTVENTATDGRAIVAGFVDDSTGRYGNVVIEGGRLVGEVDVYYTSFDISGGEFDALKISHNEGSVVGGMLKGGSFGAITVKGTSFADCIAEHSYYYNASDEMLIPAAEATELTDVTVKPGTDLSKYAAVAVGKAIYDGSAQKPAVTVTVNGVALTEGTDFTVSYENNVNAGNTAKAVVTGKGIYSGTAEKNFTIEKADLSETDFTVGNTNPTYAYNATHEVTVTLPAGLDAQYVKVGYSQGGTILTDLPKNAGTYDVSISVVGSPNYNDTFFQNKWQLVIDPKEAFVTVGALGTEEYFFNGYPHTPTVFLDLGVLPAPTTEFEGCTVTYENNTQVGTAKVIVGGNYKGEATFVIQKGKPTIGLTSPLDKVMPGYVLTLTPTTTAIDNFYYPTTFTIEDGEGYSVDGFKITIDSGVAVNDVITIKVKSTETDTYQAATGELKLTVGVPTLDTSELKTQIDDLQDQLDTLEESTKDHATQTALNDAISDLQHKLDTLKGTVDTIDSSVDTNANDIIALSQNVDTLINEVDTLKKLVDSVAALEAADVKLQNAIDTNKEALAKELGEKYHELIGLIGTIPTGYTSVSAYVAAVNEALDNAVDTLNGTIDTLRQDMVQKDGELDKAIADLDAAMKQSDADLSAEIASLNTALINAKAALEKADADNKEELVSKIETAEATLDAAIKAVQKNLEDAQTALNKAIADGDTALDGRITDLDTALATAKATLEATDAANKTELEGKITSAQTTLQTAVDKVAKDLTDAKTALEKAISEGDSALSARISALSTALDNAVSAYQVADHALRTELVGKIETADATLDAAIQAVQKNLDDAKAALNEAIAEGDTALDGKIVALNEALATTKAALEAADTESRSQLTVKIDEAYASLDAAVKAVQKDLDDLKATLEAKDNELANRDAELANKDAELESKDSKLQTYIIIVSIVSGLALCGSGALAVCVFSGGKKKI